MRAMTPTVRFAPSPTGLLHVGNARAALINWLFARRHGGRFILRIDDTDRERSRGEYAAAIADDLRWLGLDWDETFRQSDRMALYEQARDRLIADGRLYPCYESPEELDLKRKALLAQGRPPIYDRAALRLSDAQRAAFAAAGTQPHWRFRLEPGTVTFDDLIRGRVQFQVADLSDPVLIRADGQFLYSLCSVVDDIEYGVTHIIRGEDHVTNTATQAQLFAALGGTVPIFGHYPLLADTDGSKLSKRAGSLSLQEMRGTLGLEAMAINALLAKLGTADAIEPRDDLAALVADFDIGRFSRGAPRFDMDELHRLNAKVLHAAPYAAVAERLAQFGAVDENFWLAVRPNLHKLAEVADWVQVASGPVTPLIEDAAFMEAAAALLPPAPWDGETWKSWTRAVQAATGHKGKALFLPLRRALTGLDHGPELAVLLPLIGPQRARSRLLGTD
jgi:glutamyl-tRNA synthetase